MHVHRNIVIGVHEVDQVHNKDRDRVIGITCTVLDVILTLDNYIIIHDVSCSDAVNCELTTFLKHENK